MFKKINFFAVFTAVPWVKPAWSTELIILTLTLPNGPRGQCLFNLDVTEGALWAMLAKPASHQQNTKSGQKSCWWYRILI